MVKKTWDDMVGESIPTQEETKKRRDDSISLGFIMSSICIVALCFAFIFICLKYEKIVDWWENLWLIVDTTKNFTRLI